MTGPVTEPTTSGAPAALLSTEPAPAPDPVEAKTPAETLYPEEAAEAAPVEEVKKEEAPAPKTEDKPAEETEPKAEPPPALTLESYDIKLPETVTVDDTLLNKFKAASLEAKVAPEAAQAFADLYVEALTEQNRALTSQWEATKASWTNEINSMPEFQGERAAQSTAVLGGLIEEFGSPEVRDFFKLTGDNPAVVKMLLDIAHVLVEGEPTSPGSPTGPSDRRNRSLGERLYPDATQ